MAQKNNEAKTLIISLLVTGAIVGGAGWWLTQRPGNNNASGDPAVVTTGETVDDVQTLLSWGDQSLTDVSSPERNAGIAAIAAQNYPEAISQFKAALAANPNDPESLIYLNNARIANGANVAIAVVIPAGADMNTAKEILRGVAQAQDAINQGGGINGTPLKVLIANDSNDPGIASQIAQALVDTNEVLGVVGHFSSDVSKVAAEIYQNAGLVMISPTSTAVEVTRSGNFIFRTAPTDATAAKALATYQVDTLGKQQAVIFHNSQSTYSQSLRQEFSEELIAKGGRAIAEIDLSQTNDPVAEFQQAQQQGAEALVLFPNSATLNASLSVLNANQRQLPTLAGDDVYSIETLRTAGANAQDMVIAIPWHIQSQPDAPFVNASRQLWGGDVSWRTAMAYDATQALTAAITQNPNRAGVQSTLANTSFSATGATDTISFVASGDRAQTAQLVDVQPGTRSGTGFDFVPLNP